MTTHSKVDVYDLVEAVRGQMAGISGAIAKANATITEGVHEAFTLFVNWSEIGGAAASQTHMNTFGKNAQLRRIVIEVQLFARQRNQIGEGLADTANYADLIVAELESQPALTPFGLSGVHTFSWSGRQGIIEYGSVNFTGAIFTLTFLCH